MALKPDFTRLIERIGNKYLLCLTAAKRAEQLVENDMSLRAGKTPKFESALVDEFSYSPLYIAFREIEEGYILPQFPEEGGSSFDVIKHVEKKTLENKFETREDIEKTLEEVEQIVEDVSKQIIDIDAASVASEIPAEEGFAEVSVVENETDDVSIEVLQEREATQFEEEAEEETS
jgi:DNA-directed RNA polymerase omega subunit